MSSGDVSQWAGLPFLKNIQENILQVKIKLSNTLLSILARISYARVLMSCWTPNVMMTSSWPLGAHFQSRWWLSFCLALCNVFAGWKQEIPVTHPWDNFQSQKSSNKKQKTTFCQLITWTPSSSKTSICEREIMNVTFMLSETYVKRKCAHKTVRWKFWHHFI